MEKLIADITPKTYSGLVFYCDIYTNLKTKILSHSTV